jgi:proteasome assembly chaperone (PAC2) family protein
MGSDYAGNVSHVSFLEHPELRQPAFICAFRGWNDGGEAASLAAGYLRERWQAREFAHLDPEEFYDFQVTRPTVRLEDGVSRVIDWPRGEFSAATARGRDVVVFTAAEPNMHWKTFAGSVIGVAKDLASPLLLTFGAFLTDVPHTRSVPVVGSAQDEETASRLGIARSQYEGPTGIVGVLHDLSNRAGLPSVSLWAAVPHYLPAGANPKAALALIERATALLDVSVETEPLSRAAANWEEGVGRLVEQSEELQEYVSRLEAAADENARDSSLREEGVPSGDAIAAELERFLREQGGPGGPAVGGAPPR